MYLTIIDQIGHLMINTIINLVKSGKERMIKYMDRLYDLCNENNIKLPSWYTHGLLKYGMMI